MRPNIRLAASRWQFPSPAVHELPNGLTVWHFPMPGQQVAAFELLQPIRLDDEPRHLEGVGTLACRALDEQTISHPQMQELLDAQGAALHGAAGHFGTRIGGLVPARRLARLAPLVVEVLSEPAYDPQDLALHVEALTVAHRSRRSSTTSAAQWAFRQALFADGERRGRPVAGTPPCLAAIEREDVVEWHTRHFAPSGATLVLAGDLDDPALEAWGQWQGQTERSPIRPATPGLARTVVVDVPGAVQATIIVGRRSIARQDARWAPARLAGHVLAGGFASRLNLELRERLGYTYGAGGGFSPDPTGSTLQISTNTRTDVAGEALRRMLAQLALTDDVTPAELADAKSYRIGVAPLANETSADIAAQAASLAESSLTTAFVNDHAAALAEVSEQEASRAWRELVSPDALVIAVAGNAEELRPQLVDLDPALVELD